MPILLVMLISAPIPPKRGFPFLKQALLLGSCTLITKILINELSKVQSCIFMIQRLCAICSASKRQKNCLYIRFAVLSLSLMLLMNYSNTLTITIHNQLSISGAMFKGMKLIALLNYQ